MHWYISIGNRKRRVKWHQYIWPWVVLRSKSRSLRFRSLISCTGAELGHMLLLNIKRKAYIGSPLVQLHFHFTDLQTFMSNSLRLWALISHKGAELGHMLLLNINKRPYMGTTKTLAFGLSDIEMSSQGHSDFEALYLVKEQCQSICYYLTLIGKHMWGVHSQCNYIWTYRPW